MSEPTTDQEIAGAVNALKSYTGYFPREAVQTAVVLGERLSPQLVEILEAVVAKASVTITDEDWQAFTIAVHLLSKSRSQEAFKPLIAACHLPADTAELLFGDAITEGLAQYLGSTFDGDFEALRQLVLDEALDGFMRGAAIKAYLVLFRNGVISRGEILAAFRQFFIDLSGDTSFVVLTSLVCYCVEIHATELIPEIRAAFASDRVDDMAIDLDYAETRLAGDADKALAKFHEDQYNKFIEDPVKEMEWWACWKDNQERRQQIITESRPPQLKPPENIGMPFHAGVEPYRNEHRGIGRNDPCPCGSGNKFKKCCLGKADKLSCGLTDQKQTVTVVAPL